MSRRRRSRGPQRSDDGNAFLRESEQRTGARDALAERLAEDFERAVLDGDGGTDESKEDLIEEQLGGPFVESTAEAEFGDTVKHSDVQDEWEAAPIPEAVAPLTVASAEEEQAEVETRAEETGEIEHPDPDAEIPSIVPADTRGLTAPRQRS